ncbi:S8 family serine peptidase [Bacillus cereus]|uniref:S8 family serine peptidase n=1 Tax=Bacillus cereus TaxID=1396 RepID=UPI0039818717
MKKNIKKKHRRLQTLTIVGCLLGGAVPSTNVMAQGTPYYSNISVLKMNVLTIKFKKEVDLPYIDEIEKQFKSNPKYTTLADIFSKYPSLTLKRTFVSISAAEARKIQSTTNSVERDLITFYEVAVPDNVDITALHKQLEQSPFIEKVEKKETPVTLEAKKNKLIPNPFPANPNDDPLSRQQGYLNAAPEGIDAKYAWQYKGGRGEKTAYADMERGWQLNHEDLKSHGQIPLLYGSVLFPQILNGQKINEMDFSHGTSVLGIISADDNNIGAIGVAHKATPKVTSAAPNGPATAINQATQNLRSGDVIVIELGFPHMPNQGQHQQNAGPLEIDSSVHAAIKAATAKGITVVEAAANSMIDLDRYQSKLTQDNSGAIMVGAANPNQNRARSNWGYNNQTGENGGSNHGSRVDVFAWGDNVTTLTSKNTWDTASYTHSFNGTSSATPIISGAVLAIQGIAKEKYGKPYTPAQIKAMLKDPTGQPTLSANPEFDRIGVMPNLKGIIDNLIQTDKYIPDGAISNPEFSSMPNPQPINPGGIPGPNPNPNLELGPKQPYENRIVFNVKFAMKGNLPLVQFTDVQNFEGDTTIALSLNGIRKGEAKFTPKTFNSPTGWNMTKLFGVTVAELQNPMNKFTFEVLNSEGKSINTVIYSKKGIRSNEF